MSKIEAKIEAVFQVYWKLLYTKAFTCKLDCSPQITVPDWVVQESFFREDFSVKMGPQNHFQQNKTNRKRKISCIAVPIHLSCIHVSVLFISTIGLVRKSRKLSRALLNLRNVGVIWKLNKPKMHQPEEIRLWTDRRLFRKHQSSCRLLHATLQVYSTSFVRSSCVTEEKYLTTNLQTSKSED